MTPLLPSLNHVPFNLAIDSASGYVFGKLNQVNPVLTMTIFTIRGFAHTVFYLLANSILSGKGLKSHKIYIATSFLVNMTFLIVLRELNLIGRFFSLLFGAALIGHLIHRVNYIEQKISIQEDGEISDSS